MSTTRTRSKAKATTSEQHNEQWIKIAILVVFISGMIVAAGFGMRYGKKQGEERAIAFMVQQLHEKMDKPCFDKLVEKMEKR